ncbi:MAG: isocitrate lyase/PEP mutase family protein [Chloroflexi bacterium]|nr:isocitrate lyase/PEP mutase family protein [Chloroflexota bacterium]
MSAKSQLHEMLQRGETVVAPGAYDPLTGRIVQRMGFKACYVGGWMTGAHLATTEPLTTLTEQVEVGRKVARAVDIPVIVDADAGFGEPLQVVRAVHEYEEAGIAAIHIEDQVYPKRASYHRGLEHVVPREEFLAKIRYALKARRDRDFLIIARSDAGHAAGGSWQEAVARLQAAAELGADAIMPLTRTSEQMEQLRSLMPNPPAPMLTTAYFNGPSVKEMEALGFRIIIYPIATIAAAVSAIMDLYAGVRDAGECRFDPQKAQSVRSEIEAAIGLPEYYKLEDETTERRG